MSDKETEGLYFEKLDKTERGYRKIVSSKKEGCEKLHVSNAKSPDLEYDYYRVHYPILACMLDTGDIDRIEDFVHINGK